MKSDRHIYDRVYLIGVDGAGRFFTETPTPNIDRIFADGTVNHNVVTAYPTISAECWGSMLHGVTPRLHGFMNGLVGEKPLAADYPYPSMFKAVHEYYPEKTLMAVSNWNPINVSIIEDEIGVIRETSDDDDEICRLVCEGIRKNDPGLLFVQFDSVDGAGHRNGYGAKEHLEQLTHVDGLIGRIYDTARECGTLENTLVLVTADHGGTPEGGHGGATDPELYVSFYAAGQSVKPGTFGYMEIRDTPSIVTYAFGIEQPEIWSSRVPDDMFMDCVPFERKSETTPDGRRRYSDRKNRPFPANIREYAKYDSLLCRYTLDGTIKDETGKTESESHGKLYFTEGFDGMAAKFDDSEIEMSPVKLGTNYFNICMWLKIPEGDPDRRWTVFSTKDDGDDDSTGVGIYVHGDEMEVVIGFGNDHVFHSRSLPPNYRNNWFNFMINYDRRDNELCFYYDFILDSDYYVEHKIPLDYKLDGESSHIGNCAPLMINDILVFDYKLSDPEIFRLKDFYEQE